MKNSKNFRVRESSFLNWQVFHFYLHWQPVRFVIVGAIGAIVNLITLISLVDIFHFHVTPAYLIALEVSIITNFCLNHWFTFGTGLQPNGSSTKILVSKLLRYNLVSLAGATIAWLVFSLMFYYGLNYVLADVCGIAAATSWNYGLSKWLVWPSLTTRAVE